MGKKVIFLISIIVVLLLAGGGVFYWWQNQADVRELNKTLPVGVRVEKSLAGEYKVVNDIDGYEFKVPGGWMGVQEIAYTPESTEQGYVLAGIELEGVRGDNRIVVVNRFKTEKPDTSLEPWAKNNFETFGLIGDFRKDIVSGLEVIKIQETTHLLGMYVYFFKMDSAIYAITNGSEDFIRYIITNGKW